MVASLAPRLPRPRLRRPEARAPFRSPEPMEQHHERPPTARAPAENRVDPLVPDLLRDRAAGGPTLIMLVWAAIAAGTVVIAWRRQPRLRPLPQVVRAADSSVPGRERVSVQP
jgi:UDP:flavonoid glycosyltransferase YjiC (YdhE family)